MVSVSAAIDAGSIPAHIAIIMDGNGRWAKSHGVPRAEGHRRGAEAVRRVVEAASNLDVAYLTLFGFSSENWKRPEREVKDLMLLLRMYLRSEIAEMHKNNVRFLMIGDRSKLPKTVITLIDHAESTTVGNTGLTLVLALSYGGRQEIVSAVKKLCERVRHNDLHIEEIDDAAFTSCLLTNSMPDPDLVIRTSGEQRVSNFLLWQIAYSEFVFMDILWPDFGENELRQAITEFQSRDRRYGSSEKTGIV
jgi:undecaprenyl diphosphate synthase